MQRGRLGSACAAFCFASVAWACGPADPGTVSTRPASDVRADAGTRSTAAAGPDAAGREAGSEADASPGPAPEARSDGGSRDAAAASDAGAAGAAASVDAQLIEPAQPTETPPAPTEVEALLLPKLNDLAPFDAPHRLLGANATDARLEVIDGRAQAIVDSIPLPAPAYAMQYEASRQLIAVAHGSDVGFVTLVDVATTAPSSRSVAFSVVGTTGWDVDWGPDGLLYVLMSNGVATVDADTNALAGLWTGRLSPIDSDFAARRLLARDDGVFVDQTFYRLNPDGSVTGTETGGVPSTLVPRRPQVSADGTRMLVARLDGLVAYDVGTSDVAVTYPYLPGQRAWEYQYHDDHVLALIRDESYFFLQVYDLATTDVLWARGVLGDPHQIGTLRLLVVNEQDQVVYVYHDEGPSSDARLYWASIAPPGG